MIQFIGRERGVHYYVCCECMHVMATEGDPNKEHVCQVIELGPGTELAKMFHSLGITPCDQCVVLKYKMNEWGVLGCRDNLDYIVDDIKSRTVSPKYLVKKIVELAISNYEKKCKA